jgi:hypothetical protein
MARVASPLTIENYQSLYGHQSGWEYRAGRAYRKPVPTFLHGLLAILLGDLLRLAGYVTSVKADVRLTEDWSPQPDVCGVLKTVVGKYPPISRCGMRDPIRKRRHPRQMSGV